MTYKIIKKYMVNRKKEIGKENKTIIKPFSNFTFMPIVA